MRIDIMTRRAREAGTGRNFVACAQGLLARLLRAPQMAPTVFRATGDLMPPRCC